ncbi:MAG: DUF5678 domain-containing protein, partial [Microcystaceae cyanobacterium]
ILECRFNCLIMEQEETCHQIEELEQAPEPNLDAYEQFKSDTEKIKQFEGKYIAFVDGKLVDSDNNKQNLLERLWQNYPNEPCFFKKVGEENRIIEIPYFDII